MFQTSDKLFDLKHYRSYARSRGGSSMIWPAPTLLLTALALPVLWYSSSSSPGPDRQILVTCLTEAAAAAPPAAPGVESPVLCWRIVAGLVGVLVLAVPSAFIAGFVCACLLGWLRRPAFLFAEATLQPQPVAVEAPRRLVAPRLLAP